MKDLSYFASQFSLFRGGVAGGDGFGVRVGGSGGGGGGRLSGILQTIQIEKSSLYAYPVFGGGRGSSGDGVLRGIG